MAQQKSGRKPRNIPKRTFQDELQEIDNMDTFVREQVLNFKFKINCKFKNKKQKEMYDTILNNRITFVSGPAGTGKAQPLESPILTPNGWIKMGEIEIGDRVISVDGNSTVVTGIYPQGNIDIWELTFSDGSKVECCSEHLWYTQTEQDRNSRKHIGYLDGKRIREKYQKEGSVKTTLEIVETLYDKRNRVNHSIPIVSPVNFTEQKVLIDPYVMGCLLGDGSFRHHLGFTSEDNEIIELITKIIKEDNMVLSHKTNCDYNIISEKIKPKTLKNKYKDYIEKLGIYGKYSDEKFIPNCYKYNTIENRIKILQGLMDTDGTISKNGTFVSYTSTSIGLIQDVKELVQSLGGIATDHKVKHPFYTYNGEKKQGKDAYTLTITMNGDINPFKLSRKRDLVIPKTKYKPTRYIVAAKLIGKKEAQCITVEHLSHLYITNDYIVTHNTLVSLMAGLECVKNPDINISQIVMVKPIVEITSQKGLGALPGGLEDKTFLYFTSFYDNLTKIIGNETTKYLKDNGVIKDTVLNYLRGSTFGKYTAEGKPIGSFCIFDETQNCTETEMKTFISRMGEETKLVIMGDIDQTDLKLGYNEISGLEDGLKRLKDIQGIGFIEFTEDDIVRDPFLIEIMKRYRTKNNI